MNDLIFERTFFFELTKEYDIHLVPPAKSPPLPNYDLFFIAPAAILFSARRKRFECPPPDTHFHLELFFVLFPLQVARKVVVLALFLPWRHQCPTMCHQEYFF